MRDPRGFCYRKGHTRYPKIFALYKYVTTETQLEFHEMAGHLIRRLNQNSTHVFTLRMKNAGLKLTPVQFAALNVIHEFPGIDQATIAAKIAYDRATIGGVIDRLEKKGWISRSVNPNDRRAREVHITPAGTDIFTHALPLVRQMQAEILPELSEDERAMFLGLAQKVAAGIPDY